MKDIDVLYMVILIAPLYTTMIVAFYLRFLGIESIILSTAISLAICITAFLLYSSKKKGG